MSSSAKLSPSGVSLWVFVWSLMLFQIRYQLKQDADIRLSIFDITGREVRALFSGRQRAGDHSAIWNGADDSGKIVASGIYFVKLQDGKRHSLVRKMTMVK